MKLTLNWYFPKEMELTEYPVDTERPHYESWLQSTVNSIPDAIFFYTTPSTDIFDDPKQMVVVKRHQTDTYHAGPPVFCVVAVNERAAKQWIQDEVDGKHNSGNRYAQGKDADWWIEYGTFSLTKVDVQE